MTTKRAQTVRQYLPQLVLTLRGKNTRPYHYHEVKHFNGIWKDEFRKENNSDALEKMSGADPTYQEFAKQIDDYLEKCERIKDASRA